MSDVIVIDGSSGGGQMLRNAVALSALSGRPVRVENIRGARPRPGLRPQHLTAVRAAAEASGAVLTGAEIDSRWIEFRPGELRARSGWRIDVGTAGSLTLVLQCVLPALSHAPGPSDLTLIGGTDVPFAPPFDYFREVFAPALGELGPRVEASLESRGFYPEGRGEARVRVQPATSLVPVSWAERGAVERVRGRSYSLGLPAHIAERMRAAALGELKKGGCREVEIELEVGERGRSEGCGIVLWAEAAGGRRLDGSALGRRGKRAEEVGREAARELLSELAAGGAVDKHLADQMIVWMSVAAGSSELTTSQATDHLRAAAEVAEAVTGAVIAIEETEPVRVRCEPGR